MKMYLINFLILLVFQLCACSSPKDQKLKFALELAGENKKELEKVLNYYQNDPVKLAAARFLIENMLDKRTKIDIYQDSAKQQLSAAIKNKQIVKGDLYIDNEIVNKWSKLLSSSFNEISDLEFITSDFIIENVDLSFLVWKKYPWNRTLSFDDFCEYILPYRVGNEELSNWRRLFYEKYSPLLDAYGVDDVVEACNILIEELRKKKFYYNTDFTLPHFGGSYLFENRVGGCREGCDIGVYAMRACGIPVAVDQYIYSPTYQRGHSWNVVRDTTGAFLPFWYINFVASRDMKDDGRKKGKVYRHCYGIQTKSFSEKRLGTSVPALFRDPLIKDVSANYFGENEVEIPVDKNIEFTMLSVFSPVQWIAVDMVSAKGGKAIFRNIEKNVLFQPLILNSEGFQPAGYPFVFDGMNQHYFEPDTNWLEEVELTRKFPLRQYSVDYMNRNMCGAKIEGSKDRNFAHPVLLTAVFDTLTTNRYVVNFQNSNAFRYLRFASPKSKPIELAEITLYRDTIGKEAIPMKIIESPQALLPIKEYDSANLNDGNPHTYYVSRDSTCQVVFDLGKETLINRLSYIPRNDENFIVSGNKYELFYQAGRAGWKSLGRQEAKSNKISYAVPKGAILWLRNLTEGQEEQLFYIENGNQIFTCDINYKSK